MCLHGLQDGIDVMGRCGIFLCESAKPQRAVGPRRQAGEWLLRHARQALCQLPVNLPVDRGTPVTGDGGTDPAVHEQDAVDVDDGVTGSQPLAVLPVSSKRVAQFGQACGGLMLHKCPGRCIGRPEVTGSRRRKRLNLLGAGVPKVAEHHHHDPQECVHAPARQWRLSLQPHEQVQRATRLRSTIDHIPRLHQMGSATCPMGLGVDHAGVFQNRSEPAVFTVNIPDRDDTRDAGDAAGIEARGETRFAGVHHSGPWHREHAKGGEQDGDQEPNVNHRRRPQSTLSKQSRVMRARYAAPRVTNRCPRRLIRMSTFVRCGVLRLFRIAGDVRPGETKLAAAMSANLFLLLVLYYLLKTVRGPLVLVSGAEVRPC